MPFTTVAFIQSVDPAGVFTAINAALGEDHVNVTGTDIKVPELSQICAVAAGVEIAVESFARLTAPSLRGLARYEIAPFSTATAAAVEPASPHPVVDLRRGPLALVRDEVLNAEIQSNPVAAQIQWVIVWFCDGPIEPVAGRQFSVRMTGTTALTANVWTKVPLTLTEDLPRGRYQVVGMRAESAGCVAARLVPIGGRWRPGVLGCDAQSDLDHKMFRQGELGVFAEFEDTDTPGAEFLSVSPDTAEDVVLDLVQMRAGPA
jgi:hypothetical protein